VGSFELLPTTATEAAKAAYQWRPIYNARVIHCALFGCTPVVASYDGQPSRIVNFEQCALARRLFQPAEGVFDLGDPSLAVGNEIQAGGVLITTLLVGCWAYDESSLVRATALTPLVPKQTFNYRKALSMNCQDGSDGISCYDESGFGTCFQGHCRQRCLHDPDCSAGSTPPADVANDAGLEPPEGGVMPDLTSLSCRMLDTSQHVGVCIKEPHEGG
jgi:hypothetical protein